MTATPRHPTSQHPTSGPQRKRKRKKRAEPLPFVSVLITTGVLIVVAAVAFWVITSIAIRTNDNTASGLSAVAPVAAVKTAQMAAFDATGSYLSIDALIEQGYLDEPTAGDQAPTVRDVVMVLGGQCFVEAIRSKSGDLYYNTSKIGSSKQLSGNDRQDSNWCAPFPDVPRLP